MTRTMAMIMYCWCHGTHCHDFTPCKLPSQGLLLLCVGFFSSEWGLGCLILQLDCLQRLEADTAQNS